MLIVLDFRQNDFCEFHLWFLVGGRLEDLQCQCQCSVFSKREEVGFLCLNTNKILQSKDAEARHFHENPFSLIDQIAGDKIRNLVKFLREFFAKCHNFI